MDFWAECWLLRLLYGNEGSLMALGVLLAGWVVYKSWDIM